MKDNSSLEVLPIEIICLESVRAMPSVQPVISELGNGSRTQLVVAKNLQEIEVLLEQEKNFLILLSSASSVELTSCLQWLQSRKKSSVQRKVRIVFFNFIAHPKVVQLLVGQGCHDVIDARLPARTVERKLRGCIQAFLSPVAKPARETREKVSEPTSPRTSGGKGGHAPRDRVVTWEEALDCPSDCWLVTDPGLIKFVMGRWMLLVLGPGPSAGKWERTLSDPSDRQCWEWKPRKAEQDPFILKAGVWIYSGREPEFVWKFNLWRFVGEQPTLVFRGADGVSNSRFSTNSTKISICKNSSHAEAKRDSIRETIEASLQIKGMKTGAAEKSVFDEENEVRVAKDYLLEVSEKKGPADFREEKSESTAKPYIQKHEAVEERDPWSIGTEAFKRMEIEVRLAKFGTVLEFISFENHEATFTTEESFSLELNESVDLVIRIDEVSPSEGSRKNKEASTFVGRVKRAEQIGEGGSELVLEIPSESSKVFQTIASVVQSRQDEILDFFSQARGI